MKKVHRATNFISISVLIAIATVVLLFFINKIAMMPTKSTPLSMRRDVRDLIMNN